MDRLQAQLKELIFLPHDLQLLPESVVAAIQEYQRYLGADGGGTRHLLSPPNAISRRRVSFL